VTKKCLKANVVVLVKQLVLMVGIFNFLEGAYGLKPLFTYRLSYHCLRFTIYIIQFSATYTLLETNTFHESQTEFTLPYETGCTDVNNYKIK